MQRHLEKYKAKHAKMNSINDLAQYTSYMTYIIVNTKQLGISGDYKIRIPTIPVH